MKAFGQIIFISITVSIGCQRSVLCLNQYATPAFIGFKLSELETLVIREYKKDGNFLALLTQS